MTAGIKAEKLYIGHMRKPRQRVPVDKEGSTESPLHAFVRKPLVYKGIVSNILRVVNIDESIVSDIPINAECNDNQKERDNDISFTGIHKADVIIS